jgi:hypothetical protein
MKHSNPSMPVRDVLSIYECHTQGPFKALVLQHLRSCLPVLRRLQEDTATKLAKNAKEGSVDSSSSSSSADVLPLFSVDVSASKGFLQSMQNVLTRVLAQIND